MRGAADEQLLSLGEKAPAAADDGGGAGGAGVPSPWRWWVLATYTLMAANQGLTWSVPGSLEPTLQAVYGMDQDTVQLLLNYGPIFYCVAMLPVMWSIDRHGVRAMTLAGIALVLASNAMRCFANDGSALSIAIVHVSFILNAIAGPAAMAIPSKLAEDWFPPSERTTATAISALGNQTGVLLLYLLMPTLCPDTTAADQLKLNLLLAAISVLNALMAGFYFPSHPPHAPSASARVSKGNEARIDARSLVASWRAMLANRGYVAIVTVYAVLVGVSNCTGALLTANLGSIGADVATAGWIGFAANAAALVVGVALAALSDSLKRRWPGAMRAVLVCSVAGCGACFATYTALLGGGLGGALGGYLMWTTAVVYMCASALLGAAIPIMFDLGAELTFPQPEGAMLMLLTGAMNAVGVLVLAAPASSFFLWANPATSACGLAGAALLWLFLPASAPRLAFDEADGAARGSGGGSKSGSFLGDSEVGARGAGRDGGDESEGEGEGDGGLSVNALLS